MKLSFKHVSNDEDVEFERIVWDGRRKFRGVLVPAESTCDQLWAERLRDVDRDTKVHIVVFGPAGCPGAVFCDARIVRCSSQCDGVESFRIHGVGIHEDVVLDTISGIW